MKRIQVATLQTKVRNNAKSIGYVGVFLSYTSEYGIITVGYYADHGYMGSRILVKFDLIEI